MLTFLLLALGCTRTEQPVEFSAALGRGHPAANLEIMVVPIDLGALLDSLERSAKVPKPDFSNLEAELAAYVAPDDSALEAAAEPWRLLRDSLTVLVDSLNELGRGSAAYSRLFRRFRETQPRLAPLAAQRDSLVGDIISARQELAERATVAAESLRAWERMVHGPAEELALAALEQTGRDAGSVVTDSTGSAHIELAPGRWWATARVPDPENPFLEYVWNVGFTVSGWMPLRIPLSPANATRRWRH